MKVRELMTKGPEYATPDMDLQKVAKMMADHQVGSIPVLENKDSMKVIGMVTDRDIAVRTVAQGRNPLQMRASDVMSTPVVSVKEEDDVREVARMMEKNMVRRLPVVDQQGKLIGMVAQADIALKSNDKLTGDVVEGVSKPTRSSNNV